MKSILFCLSFIFTPIFVLLCLVDLPSVLGSGRSVRIEASVPCQQCFPLETLPPPLRERAAELLLKALDGEALYTFVGDLKPMSSGFVSFNFEVQSPLSTTLTELEDTRRILATWRCGQDYYAGLHHFAKVYEGKRYVDGLVIRRNLLEKLIDERRAFFSGFGITRQADPLEVISAVEYASSLERLRHYGYLFGYPDHAVDFFVAAAKAQEADGRVVKREFLRLPTFRASDDRSPFVYAVPVGHLEKEADKQLRREAEVILAEYRLRRQNYIGQDRAGVVRMLRDWFDDGSGYCSADQVKVKFLNREKLR
jgi:hypothetical protein